MREKATNTVTVTARSGNIILESRTNSDGNYSILMPAGVEFHVTADTFVDGQTYTAGMLITDAALVEDPDLIFTKSHLVQGSIWLREPSINESSVQWGNGIFGSQGTEVIATDSNGLEWRKLRGEKQSDVCIPV